MSLQEAKQEAKLCNLTKYQTYFKRMTTISWHTNYALIRQGEVGVGGVLFFECGIRRFRSSSRDIVCEVELSSGLRDIRTEIETIDRACLLVPNAGLLPKIPVLPEVPDVLVTGRSKILVAAEPVADPNPVKLNTPVVPKLVAGSGTLFEGVRPNTPPNETGVSFNLIYARELESTRWSFASL